MELNQYINKLLEKESFRKEYEKQEPILDIARQVIHLRISKNKTQEELAKLVKTKQPSIARIESGNSSPSFKMLEKISKALGGKLVVSLIDCSPVNSPTITNISISHLNNYTQEQKDPWVFIHNTNNNKSIK